MADVYRTQVEFFCFLIVNSDVSWVYTSLMRPISVTCFWLHASPVTHISDALLA